MATPTRNAGRKPKYNCLFCRKGITKTDLWKVDVYPKQQHQELSADTFRCCTGCSRSLFHTALKRLTAQGKAGTSAGKRHRCLYCEQVVASAEVWTIDAYPAQRNAQAAGEMVRVCEGCARSFFALRDEKLADMSRKRLDDMPDETEGALMMDDPDYDVHVMPDGCLDWHWFHRRRRLMAERKGAGQCVDCGRPQAENGHGYLCMTAECRERSEEIDPHRTRRHCSFCGVKHKPVTDGSWALYSPDYPSAVEYCSDCRDEDVPPEDEGVGQMRLI